MLWLHASNAARFEQSVQSIVDRLSIPGRRDPKADFFGLLEMWLRDRRKGRWLLILDNADDASFLREPPLSSKGTGNGVHDGVSMPVCLDYLPVCDHGSILFTTRSRDAATELVDDRDIVAVPPMDEQHAKILVEKKLGRDNSAGDVAELAGVLEYMPLAIAQATAYIKQ